MLLSICCNVCAELGLQHAMSKRNRVFVVLVTTGAVHLNKVAVDAGDAGNTCLCLQQLVHETVMFAVVPWWHSSTPELPDAKAAHSFGCIAAHLLGIVQDWRWL